MSRYVIRGGVEGKRRLEIIARVLAPTTSTLLQKAGMTEGMRCLDLGCGGGTVTFQLAAMAGPTGEVVGLDMDETKLELARQAAAERGLHNVQFLHADVQRWSEESQYDLVYSRFLLTHVKEPAGVLGRMGHAVRAGGVVVVEDIDFTGYFCYPPSAGFEASARLYRAVVARNGGDADIGPKLHGMFLDAGLDRPSVNVIQPLFASGEGKRISLLTLINIGDSLLADGMVTERELQSIVDDLERYTDDPRTLISLPRLFQVWGRRSSPR